MASPHGETYLIRPPAIGFPLTTSPDTPRRQPDPRRSLSIHAGAADESSGLPGPAELLASAFAACLLKNVERASQLMPFDYRGAAVDATAHRQDIPPRFTQMTYEIPVVTDESEDRAELLHRNLRKFGTVYNTLAAVCIEDRLVRKPITG